MSRAAQIRASEWGAVYRLALKHGDKRLAFDAMCGLREQWPDVDPRAIVRALETGTKQGEKVGRPPKERCPHCGK